MISEKEPLSLENVLSLRKRGLSFSEIGKLTGKSKQAVSQLLKRSGVDVEAVEQYKRDKPFLFHAVQKKVLDSITSKVIEKMSGRDRFIAVGITQDKIRDLEGGAATSIISIINIAQRAEASQPIDVTPDEVGA